MAASSKILCQNCKGQKQVVHFPFYISRKRPIHAQINSFLDSLAYRQSSLTQGEDYTFKEFYHTCFRQFTYLRCNFSIKNFGKHQSATVKLGRSYFTDSPCLFVKELLSCTVENIYLSVLRGYRSLDFGFEDFFSKSRAFLMNFIQTRRRACFSQ